MRRTPASSSDTALRLGLAGAGAAFLASAALTARLALQHMAFLGDVCGASTAHCGWCAATVALAAAGLASFALAARTAPACVKARA